MICTPPSAQTSAYETALLAFLNEPGLAIRGLALSQACFQSGVDTDCTPVPAKGNAAQSFPMDKSHGFGVAHDKVWDGSVENPATGLCREGTPDADGRCQNGLP